LFRSVDGVDDALASALYDCGVAPEIWAPCPDVPKALSGIPSRGIAIGVVSNVPWDLRPIFEQHALGSFVRAFVLSFEEGTVKPDPPFSPRRAGASS
jgi:FMN phosphatase YigB (HAD superfamily)